MPQLIDLAIELRVSKRRQAENLVVVTDDSCLGRMFVDVRLDQFLKSDVIGKRRLGGVELSDPSEIGFRDSAWGVSGHMQLTGSDRLGLAGLTHENLP